MRPCDLSGAGGSTARGQTPQEITYRATIRQWFADNLPPGWGTSDFQQPEGEHERVHFLRDWQRKLFEGGWAGMSWPKEYGGRGASPAERAIFAEERDRVKAPPDLGLGGIESAGPMIIDVGSAAQKERYLPPMLTGDELWCLGFSEPGSGSDLASLSTRAVENGDHFVVNGQKIWTSRAMWCDYMMLFARTDPEAPAHHGISALIVNMRSTGITVRPIRQINGESNFAEVFLDELIVPRQNLLGEVNKGWKIATRGLMHERIAAGTRSGLASRMFTELLYACQERDGDCGPLTDDPAVRSDLARLYTQVLGARLYFRHMLSVQSRLGRTAGEENIGKLYGGQLVQQIADLGAELLGQDLSVLPTAEPLGQPTDWLYELVNTRRYTIGGGTAQIQRNLIGERMLGLARS
jgi:alkylation response protein AidB-like acyl-CoA dehydrogenase